jgi:hypothetical protein
VVLNASEVGVVVDDADGNGADGRVVFGRKWKRKWKDLHEPFETKVNEIANVMLMTLMILFLSL